MIGFLFSEEEIHMTTTLLGFLELSGQMILILLVLGILLFGRRLPELGRSVGKTFVEFKKGVKGLEDEVESTGAAGASRPAVEPEPVRPPQRLTSSAPKFEDAPPTNSTPSAPPKV
jgi:sec-independent protein translocase protein TatA